MQGSFRGEIDVSHLVGAYSALQEPFAEPGQEFDPDEVAESYVEATASPQRFGSGPLLASSCVALVRTYPPAVCHDVNGYYRALGVRHTASRAELRETYMALKGQESEYLTYVLKFLLNDELRRIYDMHPMGSLYMDDPYIQDAIKKAAAREAARRRLSGHDSTAMSVLGEWGFQEEINLENLPESTESEQQLSDEGVMFDEWVYAYYLWQSAPPDSTDRLRKWQNLLVHELANLAIRTNFAIGLIGGEGPLYIKLDNNHVFFIDNKTSVTDQAARDLINIMKENNG